MQKRYMRYFLLVFVFFIFFAENVFLKANPFAVDFPKKEKMDNEDYLRLQGLLNGINISPLIEDLYDTNSNLINLNEFIRRCSRGIKQTLIDPQNGKYPTVHLEQIGSKRDTCIVTYGSYDGIYPDLIRRMPDLLRQVGFNGFFLYRIGGFPNPTGKEICFAGVPYCFKIFMMLEAYKLGFNKVLWVDSAAYPLKDPAALFDWIEKNETLLWEEKNIDSSRFILPATRQMLEDLTGTDVFCSRYFRTIIFGLKMDSTRVQQLISQYYTLVELGGVFLSCFPEEFVLNALIGQDEFKDWPSQSFKLLSGSEGIDSLSKIKKKKKEGYYFYHLQH
jgi:hypothetical protein